MAQAGDHMSAARRFGVAVVAVLGVAALGVGVAAATTAAAAGVGGAEAGSSAAAIVDARLSPSSDRDISADAAVRATPDAIDPHSIAARADAAWVERTARLTSIPPRALAAYAGAALAVADTYPGCGLGWNTLAGIGWVETHHGTIFAGAITASGRAEPEIIGIPLNGDGTLVIRDTDAGALDGDAVWDRAVGPMQFIPSTWALSGVDGSGDGIADPHHIDDAALSAAQYLCGAGGDLTDPQRWIAAVDAYNPNLDYNHAVAERARFYAALAS